MRRVSANKNVLSSRLNSMRRMSCCRSSAGRLFHSRGPSTPKLLSPSFDCVRGTVRVWTSADRRCRHPTSVTSWHIITDIIGTRNLHMYQIELHSIWCKFLVQKNLVQESMTCHAFFHKFFSVLETCTKWNGALFRTSTRNLFLILGQLFVWYQKFEHVSPLWS